MPQTRREQLAVAIQSWIRGSQRIEQMPDQMRSAYEQFVAAVAESLEKQSSMQDLVEGWISSEGAWPTDVERPSISDSGLADAMVAAGYWRRYQSLLSMATGHVTIQATVDRDSPTEASAGPRFGHLELLYTVMLWRRGPQRLRSMPPDRRARYERLVQQVYQRVAGCRNVIELATRYYGDGDWILKIALEVLQPMGEPTSSIGWVQDSACWRRYQELVDGSESREAARPQQSGFAVWLASQMARSRISVAELAYRLGTPEKIIRSWLNAADVPSAELGRQVAATLGLSESSMIKASQA